MRNYRKLPAFLFQLLLLRIFPSRIEKAIEQDLFSFAHDDDNESRFERAKHAIGWKTGYYIFPTTKQKIIDYYGNYIGSLIICLECLMENDHMEKEGRWKDRLDLTKLTKFKGTLKIKK